MNKQVNKHVSVITGHFIAAIEMLQIRMLIRALSLRLLVHLFLVHLVTLIPDGFTSLVHTGKFTDRNFANRRLKRTLLV